MQLVVVRIDDFDLPSRVIRMWEVGMNQTHDQVTMERVDLMRRYYVANGGWETFLSY